MRGDDEDGKGDTSGWSTRGDDFADGWSSRAYCHFLGGDAAVGVVNDVRLECNA